MSFFTIELGPKRLELLRELVPGAKTVALLVNPRSANADSEAGAAALQTVIRAGGQQLMVLHAAGEADIGPAFARLVEQRAGVLLIVSDPLFTGQRDQIVALAARYGVPTMYPVQEYVTSGGLVSYGASSFDAWRQGGVYVGAGAQGRQARRPAGAAADQVRAGHQPQDRQRRSASTCRRRCSPAPTR